MMNTSGERTVPTTSRRYLTRPIETILVLDMETTNLPEHNFYKVSITELSMYGFAATELLLLSEKRNKTVPPFTEGVGKAVPVTPRALHKLNLLFNPQRMVHPVSEKLSGLNNHMLERETPLNENAGKIIVGFLNHLSKPICLVAHNGWQFDFPILKQALEKYRLTLPYGTVCVDSLRAFMEIDAKRRNETYMDLCPVPDLTFETSDSESEEDSPKDDTNEQTDVVDEEKPVKPDEDFRALNESTPKRPTVSHEFASRKRKQLAEEEGTPNKDNNESAEKVEAPAAKRTKELKARRVLFEGAFCANVKKTPPAGVYKLSNMYERVFAKPAKDAHQAEADVAMLTKLVQYYGIDFLAFASAQAIPFTEVPPLGPKI